MILECIKMIDNEIKITWSIHDVQSRDSTLTDDDAIGVLWMLKDNHDAAVGINWHEIDAAIEAWKNW